MLLQSSEDSSPTQALTRRWLATLRDSAVAATTSINIGRVKGPAGNSRFAGVRFQALCGKAATVRSSKIAIKITDIPFGGSRRHLLTNNPRRNQSKSPLPAKPNATLQLLRLGWLASEADASDIAELREG